jgi:two-component system, LytTR family, response regulator
VKINSLIVEDEPLARNLLVDYVKKVPSLELVDVCSSPLAAIEVIKQKQVDLLFLDIQMPEITGITLLKILQKKPLVILTTAYSEYALESYDFDVVDYLLKPITLERFLRAVDKASQRLGAGKTVVISNEKHPAGETPDFIFVKDGTKLVRIRYADILYVEGLKDYVTIYTRQQKITSLQRLKVLEDTLPASKFIRIHNSYIVALDAIDTIHKGDVQIGTAMLPISDSYKKIFKEFIDRNQIQ